MSEYVYAGLTSQTVDIFLQDSSSTTGQGLSGLVYNSAGLVASYRKGATGSRTAMSLATQTVSGAWSSGGFVEIDATNMKGVYRLDIPNTVVDTEGFVTLYFYGATNLLPTSLRIDCRPLPVDVKKYGGNAGTFASGIPEVKVASIAANAINAAAIADAAIDIATFAADVGTTAYASNPLAKAIWERLLSAMTTSGSAGKKLADQANASGFATPTNVTDSQSAITSAISALNNLSAAQVAAAVPTTAQIAAAVDVALINTGDGADLLQAIANQIAADWVAGDASPVAVAAAVRTALATELARLDVAISTRLAPTVSGRTLNVSAGGLGDAVLDTAPDSPGVTTLLSRLTSGRAGNLDNLDVAVSVLQSQITALNNLSAKMNISGALLLEVPDSGTRDYLYEIVVRDDEDKLVNLDGVPTIVLTNTAGTNRSALITSAASNVATGRYRLTITVATGTNNEGLFMSAAGTVSGESRYYSIAPQVVDYDNATQVALLLTRLGTPTITVSADIAAVSTKLGTPAGASVSADIAAVKTDTGTTIPGLFTTLTTKIRKFFQLSLRKDTAIATDNAAELTEINANGGSGGGGYLSTTDSQEAIKDAGTGGGGGPGDGTEVIVDGFSLDGRAQLLTALTAAQDDGTIDASTCIPVVSGSDWRIDFADIGDLSARSNLIFAMKNRASDADADAVILVDTATGLLRANGAAAGSPAYAAITVDDALTGTGHIIIKAEANVNAPAGQKYAGLKVINSSGEIRRAESWRPCITVLNGIVDAVS